MPCSLSRSSNTPSEAFSDATVRTVGNYLKKTYITEFRGQISPSRNEYNNNGKISVFIEDQGVILGESMYLSAWNPRVAPYLLLYYPMLKSSFKCRKF